MARRRPHQQVSAPQEQRLSSYWHRTQWPLQGLYFLLPILVVYEMGTLLYQRSGALSQIKAESLLGHFFHLVGVTGVYLPGVIVVVVLVCWHVVRRRDPWRPDPQLLVVMWLEALLYALPLLVFSAVLFRQPAIQWVLAQVAAEGGISGRGWLGDVLLSMGAGIYEELLFRLIGIALLHMILVDLLALPEHWGAIGAVIGSAIGFAMYHFPSFTDVRLGLGLFYTAAGVYFALIYVTRGFGIVVGTHALYDVLVVTLRFVQHEGS